MANQGEEIFGTFVFNGINFDAGYRYDGPTHRQGGYDKCFVVYNGVQGSKSIYGHSYFGDDKFKVMNAVISDYCVVLELSYPLYEEGKMYKFDPTTFENDKIIILKRT